MESVYISQGLSHKDLKIIHQWLINDYNSNTKQGLLSSFMKLVKYKHTCWGLFHSNEQTTICIGFALLFDTKDSLHIDLFSIHEEFRNSGWGKRFILTLLDTITTNRSITLNALPNAVKFWEKLGFVCQGDYVNGEIKMLQSHYPGYSPLQIK